jgi:hypothetical protein
MPPVSTNYPVTDGQNVRLHVNIGDGQAGGSSVFLGPDMITAGHEIDVDLGPGERLRGMLLVISSTVVDVQPATNRVSTFVDLTGGNPPSLPIAQADVVTDGGTADFLTVVRFV